MLFIIAIYMCCQCFMHVCKLNNMHSKLINKHNRDLCTIYQHLCSVIVPFLFVDLNGRGKVSLKSSRNKYNFLLKRELNQFRRYQNLKVQKKMALLLHIIGYELLLYNLSCAVSKRTKNTK